MMVYNIKKKKKSKQQLYAWNSTVSKRQKDNSICNLFILRTQKAQL